MSELFITGHIQVHDGQQEAFERTVQQCVDIVREQDTGTLQYDWYFSVDRSVCVVHERYVDSDAWLDHMGHVGDQLGALFSVADFSAEIYGSPSQAVLDAIEGIDVTIYDRAYSL